MTQYKVDLHIHTCLSPCGSLEMSPSRIVDRAIEQGLSAIAITDHNATQQYPAIRELGEERGLVVFPGVEVATREEVHCVVLFPSDDVRVEFQAYIDRYLPHIPNNPERMGDQVWVNRNQEIEGEIPWSLISGIDQSINEVATYAKQQDCLFIPAHIERPSYSLISQLGFIDPTLLVDALEYNNQERFDSLIGKNNYLKHYVSFTASDAHFPSQIGERPSFLEADSLSFDSLRKACRKDNGYLLRKT
ncbi:putative metal-dependent phosphoesterase TrpH [Parabacteroides sp. PFB2-10]|uniref:PHP domain-containing protein n=1 Tax=Parabacteroides sp. PFB2-10 TaxID=1742405 RepID=UPI002473C2EE|nr:PHP domain-containing protein [Parabacteroides sp. PFB2-10]MDH6311868.1 putative metal-dependent phosphoesterase TrpH [Parabacteroides sp. PFB2-10]MDL2244020.1 PHP domain-containing protein [Parabacteroides sp. OttesenSCG-928-J18]